MPVVANAEIYDIISLVDFEKTNHRKVLWRLK